MCEESIEKMDKEIRKPDPASVKVVSKDLIKNVSGGDDGGHETGDPAGTCPYCGGPLEWLEQGNDHFVRYCPRCICIFD